MSFGGWTETRPVDGDVQMLCKLMWKTSENETGKKYKQFDGVEYQTRVVEGIYHLIKANVGEEEYVHLQIFQIPSLGKPTLEGVQDHHKREDPLEPILPSI